MTPDLDLTTWKIESNVSPQRVGIHFVPPALAVGGTAVAAEADGVDAGVREALGEASRCDEANGYRDAIRRLDENRTEIARLQSEADQLRSEVDALLRQGDDPDEQEAALGQLEVKINALNRRAPILKEVAASAQAAAHVAVEQLFRQKLQDVAAAGDAAMAEANARLKRQLGPILAPWLRARAVFHSIPGPQGIEGLVNSIIPPPSVTPLPWAGDPQPTGSPLLVSERVG